MKTFNNQYQMYIYMYISILQISCSARPFCLCWNNLQTSYLMHVGHTYTFCDTYTRTI
jgi:hypothetical protein